MPDKIAELTASLSNAQEQVRVLTQQLHISKERCSQVESMHIQSQTQLTSLQSSHAQGQAALSRLSEFTLSEQNIRRQLHELQQTQTSWTVQEQALNGQLASLRANLAHSQSEEASMRVRMADTQRALSALQHEWNNRRTVHQSVLAQRIQARSLLQSMKPVIGLTFKKVSRKLPGSSSKKSRNLMSYLVVTSVMPNSPSSACGLKRNDIIISMNDKLVLSKEDINQALVDTCPGATIKIVVKRKKAAGTAAKESKRPGVAFNGRTSNAVGTKEESKAQCSSASELDSKTSPASGRLTMHLLIIGAEGFDFDELQRLYRIAAQHIEPLDAPSANGPDRVFDHQQIPVSDEEWSAWQKRVDHNAS